MNPHSAVTGETTPTHSGYRLINILALGCGQRRLAGIVSVAAIAVISLGAAFIGVARTFFYGHDIFVMLAGGWRFLNGQRPHADYYSAFGPIPFMISGLGLRLAGNSVVGFGYGLALSSLILGISAWLLCRRRMYPIPAALAGVAVALLVAAPFPLGLRPTTLSHAMSYNRLGYALVGIVLIEAFSVAVDERDAFLGGILAGACCGIALFNKASFFGVGAVVLLVSMLIAQDRRRILGIAVGGAGVCLALIAYLHFDIGDMIRDLTIAGGARSKSLSFWSIRWALFDSLPAFLPALAGAALLAADPWRARKGGWRAQYAPLAGSLLALVGGALLLSSNAQNGGYPLTTLFALVICNHAILRGSSKPAAAPYYCAVLAVGAIAFLPGFSSDAAGMAYGVIQHIRPVPPGVLRFHQPQLSKLLLMDIAPDTSTDAEKRSNGAAYVNYVNDGVDLIQKNSQPSESVIDFDSHDAFTYTLLRPPPKGGYIAMVVNNTYSDDHKPSPERFFGNSDIVMVPKFPSAPEPSVIAMHRNYGPYLKLEFRPCAESARWVLYRRRSSSAACPMQASH